MFDLAPPGRALAPQSCRTPFVPLVALGKSAQSNLGCLALTAVGEPRELARMDCPPGLLAGPPPALAAALPSPNSSASSSALGPRNSEPGPKLPRQFEL